MKAKHIRLIRRICQIYLVWHTHDRFGHFYGTGTEILAKNHLDAAQRFHKRHKDRLPYITHDMNKLFANLKVAPKATPTEQHAEYFD